jgi:hypothetical protein
MKKTLLPLSIALGLALLAGSATDAAAQELTVPCCEGGARPNKKCETDADCPVGCLGGARHGRPCGQAGCPNACDGGADAGKACEADADCRSACIGGSRDGKLCGVPNGPGCPDGTCTNEGTCTNAGECVGGTCTAECRVRSKSKKPDNPASAILDHPTCDP